MRINLKLIKSVLDKKGKVEANKLNKICRYFSFLSFF